jgi:hypothetical protein
VHFNSEGEEKDMQAGGTTIIFYQPKNTKFSKLSDALFNLKKLKSAGAQ